MLIIIINNKHINNSNNNISNNITNSNNNTTSNNTGRKPLRLQGDTNKQRALRNKTIHPLRSRSSLTTTRI